MSINKIFISVIIGLTLLSSPFVTANDTSFGDDNGTITFKHQSDISMDKESLFISENNILVDYVFTNTSQHDLDIPIAFPMPPIFFVDSDHNEIENFKLLVNGKLQETEHKLVVLLDDKVDISDKMAKLGWAADDVVNFIQSGDIPRGKKPLPAKWFYKGNQPRFTMSNYFIWQQHFPAGTPVSIRHSYKPSVTTGVPLPASHIIENFAKETCLDKNSQSTIKKQNTDFGIGWANLRYILVTANNWQGAIKDFNLIVKKQSPSDLISLCFDNDLKKTDPLTFEFHQENFKPQQDLNLLFIHKQE
ncbi:MAG: DUF4424 family protein [Formivibrio sp.]|nr:DUF4424 family protein [Formivibrio sp.]